VYLVLRLDGAKFMPVYDEGFSEEEALNLADVLEGNTGGTYVVRRKDGA